MTLIYKLVLLASGLKGTTYGYNELKCGDIGKPEPCTFGATTASGVPFNPAYPMVAIPAPTKLRLGGPYYIHLRVDNGPCVRVLLADKSNPRWLGVRGFDLSPAAVEEMTGQPASPTWSGTVHVCFIDTLQYRLDFHNVPI